MDHAVTYCRSKGQAEEIAKILPRIFVGPIVGVSWKLEVRRDDCSTAWGVFLKDPSSEVKKVFPLIGQPYRPKHFLAMRDTMHGWCRGFYYGKKH